MPKLTATERVENEAAEAIAEGVAAQHSPAETEFDKGALRAAEEIAARIRQRRLD